MVQLKDLLEIINTDEINLIASGEPKGIVKKNNISNNLLQNKVNGIGMDTVGEKHILMVRLAEKAVPIMEGFFRDGVLMMYKYIIKWLFDMFLSRMAIIVRTISMLLFAIIIKIDSQPCAYQTNVFRDTYDSLCHL